MRTNLLIWILFGLCVLLGAPALMTTDEVWRRFLGGLSCLALGGFALAFVQYAIQTGRVRFNFSVIQRADQPWFFWSNIVLVSLASLGALAAGVRLLFY